MALSQRLTGGCILKRAKQAFIAICVVSTMTATSSAEVLPITLVHAGKPLKIVFLFSIEPDCRSRGKTTAVLLAPPEHGTVTTRDKSDFPDLRQSDSASHCNRQKVPGTAVYYEGQPGYAGSDRFTIQAQHSNGLVTNYTYNIVVQ